MAELMVLPRPAKSVQNGAGFNGNLEHTQPAEKNEWPQCHRESSWQERQSRLCLKGKEQSRLSRAPDHKESIQCQRSKENSSEGKKKRRVFLRRRTVRVKVNSEVILTSFPKFKEGRRSLGRKIGERRTVSRIGR